MNEKKIASHIKSNGWSKKVTFWEMNMCMELKILLFPPEGVMCLQRRI